VSGAERCWSSDPNASQFINRELPRFHASNIERQAYSLTRCSTSSSSERPDRDLVVTVFPHTKPSSFPPSQPLRLQLWRSLILVLFLVFPSFLHPQTTLPKSHCVILSTSAFGLLIETRFGWRSTFRIERRSCVIFACRIIP
jgi:hypothetical protein